MQLAFPGVSKLNLTCSDPGNLGNNDEPIMFDSWSSASNAKGIMCHLLSGFSWFRFLYIMMMSVNLVLTVPTDMHVSLFKQICEHLT